MCRAGHSGDLVEQLLARWRCGVGLAFWIVLQVLVPEGFVIRFGLAALVPSVDRTPILFELSADDGGVGGEAFFGLDNFGRRFTIVPEEVVGGSSIFRGEIVLQ